MFLQTWRAAIIPVIAIPVSLIGCFLFMSGVGLTFNTLSLFGLVLAIGIVVDDAIVVVENVERYLEHGMDPKDAAHKTMDEVGGALLAIALVLCAVFIPTAFITGLQGAFYKQFAITIASATLISAFVSLTLSPALAAILLKRRDGAPKTSGLIYWLSTPLRWFFAAFNWAFEKLSNGYGALTARLIRVGFVSLIIYGGLIYFAFDLLNKTPTGLIPPLDRGYLIAAFQLPPGSSLDRTDKVLRDATDIILHREGVEHAVVFAGFDGATFTNATNTGVIFVGLQPFEERVKKGLTAAKILADVRQHIGVLTDAFAFVLEPPSVPGIGTGGGLKGYVQDRAGRGLPALENATQGLVGAIAANPGFAQPFTLFNTKTPQIYADIDRTKAELLGVPISRVFEALSVYMGSAYINDFNILGRTYQVTAQADNPFRLTTRDVADLKTRNASGDMVPIGSVATLNDTTGPFRVTRYNLSRRRKSGQPRPRLLFGSGHCGCRGSRKRSCRKASASNGQRSRCRKSLPAIRRSSLSASPSSSSFSCSPRCMKAGCCRSPSSSSCPCAFLRPCLASPIETSTAIFWSISASSSLSVSRRRTPS